MSVRCLKDGNQPPSTPNFPSPANNTSDILTSTELLWACVDLDGDPILFDIYFGDSNPPSIVQSNQSLPFYNPGTLLFNTTYFWKIVAHDDLANQVSSDVWSFTTTNDQSFTCGGSLLDIRDGQSYNTIQIVSQCWISENMNIGVILNGSVEQADNNVIEKYCYDDDNPSNYSCWGTISMG
ncbi:MAG: hypothetical protein R2764_12855 [Bacteroidales bacterium]